MKNTLLCMLILAFTACGDQHENKGHMRLMKDDKTESIASKSELNVSTSFRNPASYKSLESIEIEVENTLVERNNTYNEEVSVVVTEELPLEEEPMVSKEKTVDLNTSVESTPLIVVDHNESDKNDEVEHNDTLAIVLSPAKSDSSSELKALELQMKYALDMNSKEISLQKITSEKEIAASKLANEKELQLEKLKSEKEMRTSTSANEKEVELEKLKSDKELTLAKLNSQKSIESAKLAKEKELTIAKLSVEREIETQKSLNEKETKLATLESTKVIALAENSTKVTMQERDNAFYKLIAMIVAGVIILILFIIYLMHRRSKNNELKLHQDELRHQEMLEANKQYNENVRKMLEIVADENADKGIKKEVVRLLKDQENQKQKNLLLERK